MSKKTLNQTNLEALGTEKLAALLMEVSAGSADMKRRLRLELSHNLGAAELAHEVRKRLVSLRKSTSYVGWRKRKAFIKELQTQAMMITDKIAPDDPNTAFDLLWQFTEMAPSIFGRADDSKGDIAQVFHAAFDAFAHIGPRAQLDPKALADRVWTALLDNSFGEWDGIIAQLGQTLGAEGLARLKTLIDDYAGSSVAGDADTHEALQFLRQLRGGDSYAQDRKAQFVRDCLQQIAVLERDANAYIAQYSDSDLKRKDVAAEVALILLEDARAQEALNILLDVAEDGQRIGEAAWDTAYIASLTALGRADDAQAHRWTCFEDSLNPDHLRDYLKQLPDFEDVEAEEKAKTHVLTFPHFPSALAFTLDWPDMVTATKLIESRTADLSDLRDDLIHKSTEALRTRYPVSSVRLWRAAIDAILAGNVVSRFGFAQGYLNECALIDAEITDYSDLESHADYVTALRFKQGHKTSFWAKLT